MIRHLLSILAACSLIALLAFSVSGVIAQSPELRVPDQATASIGTGFTYQGQLKNASGPINGACDFEFSLWDSLANPTGQIGATQTKTNVTVTTGLFTVQLDFGEAFNGEARWLEVAVRCPAGGSGYTTLAPRQALTPAPYAVYATASHSAAALQGSPVTTTLPALNQVLKWSGTAWAPDTDEVGTPGAGDISGVYAGMGLTGGGATGEVTVTVDFSGTGSANTVARSDHNHTATYAPLSHTHPGSDITSTVANATNAVYANSAGTAGTAANANNSDNLDGLHATAFALSTHNHDAAYVNEGQASSIASGMLVDGAALAEISNNDGTGSGLDADLLDGRQSGNANGNVPVSNGMVNTNLNADYLDGVSSSAFQPRMAVGWMSSSAVTYLTNACQNYYNGYVTITTSGAGTVIVNAQAWMRLYHVVGTDDILILSIGSTPTDCGSWNDLMQWTIPASYPASSFTAQTFHVQRVFSVAGAGTYTYYLNGYMSSGYSANTDYFDFANMNAVYYPQ